MSHHPLSPSAATRWMNCPGSVALLRTVPPRPSGPAAIEGTAAHALRERLLLGTIEPDPDCPTTQLLMPGVARLRALREAGALMLIEHRVKLDPWIPGGYGTADAVVYHRDKLLVNDLKFGLGVVDAEANDQLIIYALGCLTPKVRYITLEIDAPRARSSKWTTTRAELVARGAQIHAAALATESPEAPRLPGSRQCKWCDAAHVCPEKNADLMKDFD